MSMNVIEASGLGKRYGGTWALRECSLAIPAGHVAALVGPNGAGKTTLLNLAVGLAAPSAGGVTVLGGLPGRRRPWTASPSSPRPPCTTKTQLPDLNRRFDQSSGPADELGAEPEGGSPSRQRADVALAAAAAAGADEPVAVSPALHPRCWRETGSGCPRTCWPSSSGWPTTSSCCRGGGCAVRRRGCGRLLPPSWPPRSTALPCRTRTPVRVLVRGLGGDRSRRGWEAPAHLVGPCGLAEPGAGRHVEVNRDGHAIARPAREGARLRPLPWRRADLYCCTRSALLGTAPLAVGYPTS